MKKTAFTIAGGFTLLELLIVVAILSVLIGLLTPAILKNIGVVNKKQHKNEIRMLEAGLMEYWHDKGAWPLPKKGATGYQKPDGESRVRFRKDNYLVFNPLLRKTVFNEPGGKDYIDPSRHSTFGETEDVTARLADVVGPGSKLPLVYLKDVNGEKVPTAYQVTIDLLNNRAIVED